MNGYFIQYDDWTNKPSDDTFSVENLMKLSKNNFKNPIDIWETDEEKYPSLRYELERVEVYE